MEKAAEMEGSKHILFNCNKAPAIVLIITQIIRPYWAKQNSERLSAEEERAILYFRQKSKDNRDEFEIHFPPVTGVSSGRGTIGLLLSPTLIVINPLQLINAQIP